MDFFRQTGAAAVLVALTLWIQCAGMAMLIKWGLAYLAREHRLSLFHSTVLIVRVTSLMIGLHVVQILVWAAFYRWTCFPGWKFAFYFSSASYSTVGGDLVLPTTWRSLGPVEAVTGVLMCGLSVSLLFAIVTRLVDPSCAVPVAKMNRSSSTQYQGFISRVALHHTSARYEKSYDAGRAHTA